MPPIGYDVELNEFRDMGKTRFSEKQFFLTAKIVITMMTQVTVEQLAEEASTWHTQLYLDLFYNGLGMDCHYENKEEQYASCVELFWLEKKDDDDVQCQVICRTCLG